MNTRYVCTTLEVDVSLIGGANNTDGEQNSYSGYPATHIHTNTHTPTHDAERTDAFSKDLTSMTWLVTILSPVKK